VSTEPLIDSFLVSSSCAKAVVATNANAAVNNPFTIFVEIVFILI